jgi:hypothetical protein
MVDVPNRKRVNGVDKQRKGSHRQKEGEQNREREKMEDCVVSICCVSGRNAASKKRRTSSYPFRQWETSWGVDMCKCRGRREAVT